MIAAKIIRGLLPLAFGLTVLAVWEIAVRVNEVPPYILPGPLAIAEALWTNARELLSALGVTLQVTLIALGLAAITGALIALALAMSPVAERTIFPYAVFTSHAHRYHRTVCHYMGREHICSFADSSVDGGGVSHHLKHLAWIEKRRPEFARSVPTVRGKPLANDTPLAGPQRPSLLPRRAAY
jgi:hypothetical protein